ncbi:COX15/CtaA family protein [Catenovulum sediminis]|uniref:COX15/CtaA family protein n=1 Tax=Catenovulum sediminis TaxID=1740262 RepID=A0ABV1RLN9_9ALTE|nr:COX15/CtaA family protein [Catenovulum sediminis]
MIKLTRLAIILAFVVVVLGAYTRLTDAGLGCPDWPGCYGHLLVPTEQQSAVAQARFPDQPIEPQKAWNEMIHRYFAGTLGILILILALLPWRKEQAGGGRSYSAYKGHTFALLVVVVFQAILGMWTVTMALKPIVVMAHLIGGFSVFILLVFLHMRLMRTQHKQFVASFTGIPTIGVLALSVLILQIALGGWTSSNYAALACTQLPICEGDWSNRLDFAQAFSMTPEAESYQYGVLDYAARMTIHISHRIGAIFTAIVMLSWLFVFVKRSQVPQTKRTALLVFTLLVAQIVLGISNVFFSLPLYVAVAHNAVALLLLTAMVKSVYLYSLSQIDNVKPVTHEESKNAQQDRSQIFTTN